MFARAIEALNERLIDDWRKFFFRFWTVRLALFWGGVSGLYLAWPAFSSVIPTGAYAGGAVIIAAAIAVARVTRQSGADV